jgi:hypothetical protein
MQARIWRVRRSPGYSCPGSGATRYRQTRGTLVRVSHSSSLDAPHSCSNIDVCSIRCRFSAHKDKTRHKTRAAPFPTQPSPRLSYIALPEYSPPSHKAALAPVSRLPLSLISAHQHHTTSASKHPFATSYTPSETWSRTLQLAPLLLLSLDRVSVRLSTDGSAHRGRRLWGK